MDGRSFTGTDGVRARRQQKEAVRQRRVNEAVEVAGGTVELSGINLAEDGGVVAAAALTRLRSAVTVRLPPWSSSRAARHSRIAGTRTQQNGWPHSVEPS